MSEPIVIELGYIPPAEVRGNSRAHWRKKHHTAQLLKQSGVEHAWGDSFVLDDKKVKVTFQFSHNRKIDLDNLAIGMKPFIDGLLPDDDPDHVVYGEHSFTKVPKGESRTIVTIEELA